MSYVVINKKPLSNLQRIGFVDMFFAQIICNGHSVQKLICSQVFSSYEKWEFFDALYYCFATLTTIGSYLAFQRSSKWLFKDKSPCFSKTTCYLLFKDNLFRFPPSSIRFQKLYQLFLSRIWGLGGSSTRQLVTKET